MASFLMGGIIMKHFTGHTDVAFDKKIRMDHNHQVCGALASRPSCLCGAAGSIFGMCSRMLPSQRARPLVALAHAYLFSYLQGGSEHRIATHNSRLGMLSINKRAFNLFPFTYTPKAEIIDRHRTDK